MVVMEAGPWNVFLRLRRRVGAHEIFGNTPYSLFGSLLSCPLCVSVWWAVILYVAVVAFPVLWPLVVILGISGLASVIESFLLRP